FHTDDQRDQEWPVTAAVELPADLPGGVYAFELHAGDAFDRLPFVVRSPGDPAPVLVVLPTLTYLAYATQHLSHLDLPPELLQCHDVNATFAAANGYHSWYDEHLDGSWVKVSSIRRPMLNLRPDHHYISTASEHGLGNDLRLLGWLGRRGFPFD